MDAKSLAKAMQRYNTDSRLASPERYTAYETFRSYLPEGFKRGRGISPFTGCKIADAATVLLRGEELDDARFQEVFGFPQADLRAQLAEADPIKKPIPEKLVLMTFDDATIDHYRTAAPTLEKYGFKGNFFVTEMKERMFGGAGFEDKTAFMTWEQIKELSDRGHEIVNHSLHHAMDFQSGSDEYMREQIVGLEERCARYGIPKPTVFGYPGGGCTLKIEKMLHEMGYLWGRGDLVDGKPLKLGQSLYDPYVDTPMVVPNTMPYSVDKLHEILDSCTGNKLTLFVFHDVENDPFSAIPYTELVAMIHDYGGRCITFRELTEYVDPAKAYAYTH